jgi:hypothetical protein
VLNERLSLRIVGACFLALAFYITSESVVDLGRKAAPERSIRLVLNAVLGWWWADPAAALVMVPIILKEGIDGIKARTCC